MTVALGVAAVVLTGASGLLAWAYPRGSRTGDVLATAVFVLGCAIGVAAGFAMWVWPESVHAVPWPLPARGLRLGGDGLTGMFLVQNFGVSMVCAIYALGYRPAAEHPGDTAWLRTFLGWMTSGLGLLLLARDAISFLVGWEVMAFGAFLALVTEDRDPEVRRAGLLYLFCTRAATFALFGLFAAMRLETGSFAFATSAGAPAAVLVLALVGFGLKAGIMPLHVWLPSAHGTAPTHVSAILSGVIIKAGVYGLLRVLAYHPSAPAWWGLVLLGLGGVSAVLGVVLAIGQHDLKRLLAYHSVENIGIIVMGVGIAVFGRATDEPALVVLGVAAATLHTWNHGIFKALLFLAAGSVLHATRLRETDLLGGLARRMPSTALAFLVGAVAICGLPPLNGFVSEFLLYSGLIRSVQSGTGPGFVPMAVAASALALTGGLAALCFTKVYGGVFLGEPRSVAAREAHEVGAWMVGPMAVLCAACAAIGLSAPVLAWPIDGAVRAWLPGSPPLASVAPLWALSGTAATLAGFALALGLVLVRRLARTPVHTAQTWGCGYEAPTARMQYTASSFAEVIIGLFTWVLRPAAHRPGLRGAAAFPAPAKFHSHVADVAFDRVLRPGAAITADLYRRLHWFQRGTIPAALLYLLIAVLLGFLLF